MVRRSMGGRDGRRAGAVTAARRRPWGSRCRRSLVVGSLSTLAVLLVGQGAVALPVAAAAPGPVGRPVPSSSLLPLPGLPGSGGVPAAVSTRPKPGPAAVVPSVAVPPPAKSVPMPSGPGLSSVPAGVSTFAEEKSNADGTVTRSVSSQPLFRKQRDGLVRVDPSVKASGDRVMPAAAEGALRPIRFGAKPSRVAELALDGGPGDVCRLPG